MLPNLRVKVRKLCMNAIPTAVALLLSAASATAKTVVTVGGYRPLTAPNRWGGEITVLQGEDKPVGAFSSLFRGIAVGGAQGELYAEVEQLVPLVSLGSQPAIWALLLSIGAGPRVTFDAKPSAGLQATIAPILLMLPIFGYWRPTWSGGKLEQEYGVMLKAPVHGI